MTDRSERWDQESRDNHCRVVGHVWHVERSGRLRCENDCWMNKREWRVVLKEELDQTAAKIMAVLVLCDNWDAMTKGPSPTTTQIRAALGINNNNEGE